MKKRHFFKYVVISILLLSFIFCPLMPVVAGTQQQELVQQMEKEPVSAFATLHYTWDFMMEMAKRFGESAKPLVIFNNTTRMGGEITWYEEKLFSLTAGKYLKEDPETPGAIEFEPGWFFGIEAKLPEWPQGTELGRMFSKLRPQVLFHQGSWYFGLSYAFRNIVNK